jgi:hypothetical protein
MVAEGATGYPGYAFAPVLATLIPMKEVLSLLLGMLA